VPDTISALAKQGLFSFIIPNSSFFLLPFALSAFSTSMRENSQKIFKQQIPH